MNNDVENYNETTSNENNFSANKLDKTIRIIESISASGIQIGRSADGISEIAAGGLNTVLDTLKTCYSKMAGIVASEDSNLSGTCQQISSTLETITDKISKTCSNIETELIQYINKTLKNEETHQQSLNNINSGLDDINSELANL